MEPVTWGAVGAVLAFVLSVAGFIFKLTKDHDQKIVGMINTALTEHGASMTQEVQDKVHALELSLVEKDKDVAELKAELGVHKSEIRHIKDTALKQEDITELKSDVKTLVARLEDMRTLILGLKDK